MRLPHHIGSHMQMHMGAYVALHLSLHKDVKHDAGMKSMSISTTCSFIPTNTMMGYNGKKTTTCCTSRTIATAIHALNLDMMSYLGMGMQLGIHVI